MLASGHEQPIPIGQQLAEVIRLVVMYVRYPLSLRNVEDLLAKPGIDISAFWRGVRPRKAANTRPLAKAPASWIVAMIACGDWADAGNGHQPLSRLVHLDRRRKLPVDRSSSRASIWPTSERSAPRAQSGTTISPFRP
jgi:hypothetical protein